MIETNNLYSEKRYLYRAFFHGDVFSNPFSCLKSKKNKSAKLRSYIRNFTLLKKLKARYRNKSNFFTNIN